MRRISRREAGGEEITFELTYASRYMGLEVQKDDQGQEIPDSYSVSNNVYLNGIRIAVVVPTGESLYYLTDQVDSVKVVVDAAGLAVSRCFIKLISINY